MSASLTDVNEKLNVAVGWLCPLVGVHRVLRCQSLLPEQTEHCMSFAIRFRNALRRRLTGSIECRPGPVKATGLMPLSVLQGLCVLVNG